jgi:farnesyl diphosphate synthase
MNAINDAMLIEMMIYKILKRYLRSHPAYAEFVDLFHETTYQTELGQLMDLITAPEDSVDLSKFSIDKHAYIVEYKTAYYSFYMPIALALLYAGITDQKAFDQSKSVLIPLGEYFQVQDDYLDCYGLPEVIGKIGTDIEDNKCGWLIVQALRLASEKQREILDECYGQRDPKKVLKVKEVFKELDIERVYQKYEDDSYERLSGLIQKVDDDLVPRKMFVDFMNRIYKRKA